MKIFNREPAVILGTFQAVLALVLAFGVDLSKEQTGAILAAAAAVLALVTRSQVTPVTTAEGEVGHADIIGVLVIVAVVIVLLAVAFAVGIPVSR